MYFVDCVRRYTLGGFEVKPAVQILQIPTTTTTSLGLVVVQVPGTAKTLLYTEWTQDSAVSQIGP